MAELLDSAFVIPGTNYRIGLDPIIGLIPMVGDLASPLFTIALLWQARDLNLPRVVQMRMLFNVGIDVLVGVVPVVGDVADVFWKSNSMNFALLERHAGAPRPATAGDWLFVVGVLAAVVAIALIPLFVVYWLLYVLAAHLPAVPR